MKKMLLSFSLTAHLFAADYIVPYDYDNIVASVKSHDYGVINQSSPLSTTSWNIGGASVKYRCLSVPKISCSASTPKIIINASEPVLTKPDAVVANQTAVFPIMWDVRYEDAGTNWNVCAAAIGGTMYSNIDYTNGQITYTPNQYSEIYTYFTNVAITNSTAYISLTHSQICQ